MTGPRRLMLALAAALLVATTILGPYLAASRSQHNTQQIAQLQQTDADLRQLLLLVQQATGKPAQQAQAVMLARLVECLYNRIDADTGHGRLDRSCAALAHRPRP